MARDIKVKRKRGQRAESDSKKRWKRRVEIYRRIGTGYAIPEVAEEFGITQDVVRLDLKAIAETRDVPQIKIMVAGIYEKVVQAAWEKFKGEKTGFNQIGFLREIAETATKLARMNGLISEMSINQHLNIFGGVSSEANGYDRWSENRLREEFGKRRLTLSSGNSKKGKE